MDRGFARTLDQARHPSSALRLTVVEGATVGQEFKCDGTATIGRSPEASVLVDDPGVSRFHARITRIEGGGFEVVDLGSKNGTFVNGVRVDRSTVKLGDKIRVGPRVVLELSSFDIVEEQIVQRQRLETIGRLGAGVAHDLNNVLAALQAGTAFLEQLPLETPLGDARVRECLRDISLATEQGGNLTRGILRFLRGKRGLRETVDLSALVSEVARLLRHTIDHHVRLETQLASGVAVHGNHTELQQVLLNLCLNARDAMPDGGLLRITAALHAPPPELGMGQKTVAMLSVMDTGTGMSAETQTQIFEPFFTTKREGAGFGIGLSTVRDLVKLHGGRIRLQSAVDQGSTFTMYFPLVDAESTSATSERSPAPQPTRTNRDIGVLLVDDEQLLRRSFARLLKQHGIEVTEAESGREALELYDPARHDVVILDLDMPGMSGEATQLALKRKYADVQIMFASGHANPLREAAAWEQGARAFLQKPYDVETLVATIHAIASGTKFGSDEERTQVGGYAARE
jgi:hypothetical protein